MPNTAEALLTILARALGNFSVESEASRNNIAEALLHESSILQLVWITTRAQMEHDPFGEIYLTPQTRKGRDDLVRAKAQLSELF